MAHLSRSFIPARREPAGGEPQRLGLGVDGPPRLAHRDVVRVVPARVAHPDGRRPGLRS